MRVAASGLVVAALLLAGCSGGQIAAHPVETTRVNLPKSYLFDPAVITVPAGATVTWHNDDNFTHSVSVLGGGFPFLNLRPGQSDSITFTKPGEYHYVCTYHTQNMKGKVIVVAR